MRSSARKQQQNQQTKSRLKTLEKSYLELVTSDKKTEAATALSAVTSALDKAVKTGVIHKAKANRKKSRLAVKIPVPAAAK